MVPTYDVSIQTKSCLLYVPRRACSTKLPFQKVSKEGRSLGCLYLPRYRVTKIFLTEYLCGVILGLASRLSPVAPTAMKILNLINSKWRRRPDYIITRAIVSWPPPNPALAAWTP